MHVATASQEQAQGIEQVNRAMGQMDKVTQSNAANAEESASAAEELSAQTEQLRIAVEELMALAGGAASGISGQKGSDRSNTGMPSVNKADSSKVGKNVKENPTQSLLREKRQLRTTTDLSEFNQAA